MEWKIVELWLALLLGIISVVPKFFAPRCPRCKAPMKPDGELESLTHRGDWHLGWRRFSCPECSYGRVALATTNDPTAVKYQTHIIR